MAKYLGLDYGTKRVGVALTDESASVGFPREALDNNSKLMPTLIKLIRAEHVDEVVIGKSTDKDGKENSLMKAVRDFANELEAKANLTVHFEPEFYSSQEVRAHTKKKMHVDSQAAAIILNSFLTKMKSSKHPHD